MKCPMCGRTFRRSIKIYRSFYYEENRKVSKGSFRERRCPYCGYVLSTKKIPYKEMKIVDLKKYLEGTLKEIQQTLDNFKKYLNDILKLF